MTTMPVASRGVDDVAVIDLADAGAAVDRRGDRGVGEHRLRALSIAAWSACTCAAYCATIARWVSACWRLIGVGRGELLVALEIDPGVGQQRLVLRLLGDGLVELRLVGGRVDARQHVALLDVLAFLEVDAEQLAVDLRAHGDGVERLGGADRVEIDRHVGALGRRRPAPAPGRRRRSGRARCAAAAAPAGTEYIARAPPPAQTTSTERQVTAARRPRPRRSAPQRGLGTSPCIGGFHRLRQPAAAERLIQADDRLQPARAAPAPARPAPKQRLLGVAARSPDRRCLRAAVARKYRRRAASSSTTCGLQPFAQRGLAHARPARSRHRRRPEITALR